MSSPPPLTSFFSQKYMEDCERALNGLCEDMKTAVLSFTGILKECTRTHCDTNGSAIQKNISRISQDQARLQDARSNIEALMQENDPFRFIEVRADVSDQLSEAFPLHSLYISNPFLSSFSGLRDKRKTVEC